jgi:hypothetical protein
MQYHFRQIAVLAAVAVSAAACGPFHRGSGPPDPVVLFKNDSPDQADVYALGSGGEPIRIGTVFGAQSELLRVPTSVTGGANRVNIIARIFPSGRAVVSGPFSLAPGDTMNVTLPSDEKLLSVLPPR